MDYTKEVSKIGIMSRVPGVIRIRTTYYDAAGYFLFATRIKYMSQMRGPARLLGGTGPWICPE